MANPVCSTCNSLVRDHTTRQLRRCRGSTLPVGGSEYRGVVSIELPVPPTSTEARLGLYVPKRARVRGSRPTVDDGGVRRCVDCGAEIVRTGRRGRPSIRCRECRQNAA